jgi:cupin fold WbuC family metalloprotein
VSRSDLAPSSLRLIDDATLEALRAKACASARRRARICLHESHDDAVQQMVIALCEDSYIPPHRQKPNGKSYVLLEGSLTVAFFDEAGQLAERIRMSPDPRHGPSIVRFPADRWHTAVSADSLAIYLELAAGPYNARDTEFAGWAPIAGDPAAHAFMASIVGE